MTYIISRLPEEYQNIIEITESELYYKDNPLNIEKISDKILVKCDQMNKQSRPKMSIKYEKSLHVNTNKRVPARLAGYMGTSKRNSCIEKALKTYQNFTNMTKSDI